MVIKILRVSFGPFLKGKPAFLCLLFGTYFFAAVFFLKGFFIADATSYLGLALAPYILIVRKGYYSFRFFAPLTILLILVFFIPVKSMFFLVLLAGLLFLTENTIGKVNEAFFLLLLLISPVFKYFNSQIGFPMRLWLSKVTGMLFSFVDEKVSVRGNLIYFEGEEFSVDGACAGLSMLTISVIIALFILAFYQRQSRKALPLHLVCGFLLGAFLLNIVSNLFRIVMLVLFRIMPGNPFHDIAGILCMVVYVVIPLLLAAKYFFSESETEGKILNIKDPSFLQITIHLAIILTLLFAGNRINNKMDMVKNNYAIKGFKREILKNGVNKFENENTLIYLKPLEFYSAEHNPMICWSGSGYDFKFINKEIFYGREIYTGILEKGRDKIFTAWWFDNRKIKTIDQFEWRWKAFTGDEPFCLLNVSTLSKESLDGELELLLSGENFFTEKTVN